MSGYVNKRVVFSGPTVKAISKTPIERVFVVAVVFRGKAMFRGLPDQSTQLKVTEPTTGAHSSDVAHTSRVWVVLSKYGNAITGLYISLAE